jgi:hypothetical protein
VNEVQTPAASPEKYADEIILREERLSEIGDKIEELEASLKDTRARAIVGEIPESQFTEIAKQLAAARAEESRIEEEISALRARRERVESDAKAEVVRRMYEEIVAPAGCEMASAAHRAEAAARELGAALKEMLLANRRASAAAGGQGSQMAITIAEFSGELVAHLWALICASSEETLRYGERPRISIALSGAG